MLKALMYPSARCEGSCFFLPNNTPHPTDMQQNARQATNLRTTVCSKSFARFQNKFCTLQRKPTHMIPAQAYLVRPSTLLSAPSTISVCESIMCRKCTQYLRAEGTVSRLAVRSRAAGRSAIEGIGRFLSWQLSPPACAGRAG